jgi:hypothetical protein
MAKNISDGKSDKEDGGQLHASDTKQGKPSGYSQGIIGQANVPPSGTQYRSDRIPPAYVEQKSPAKREG